MGTIQNILVLKCPRFKRAIVSIGWKCLNDVNCRFHPCFSSSGESQVTSQWVIVWRFWSPFFCSAVFALLLHLVKWGIHMTTCALKGTTETTIPSESVGMTFSNMLTVPLADCLQEPVFLHFKVGCWTIRLSNSFGWSFCSLKIDSFPVFE